MFNILQYNIILISDLLTEKGWLGRQFANWQGQEYWWCATTATWWLGQDRTTAGCAGCSDTAPESGRVASAQDKRRRWRRWNGMDRLRIRWVSCQHHDAPEFVFSYFITLLFFLAAIKVNRIRQTPIGFSFRLGPSAMRHAPVLCKGS